MVAEQNSDKNAKAKAKEVKKEVKAPEPRPRAAIEELRDAIVGIEKGVAAKDSTFISRTIRRTNYLRRKLTPALLRQLLQETLVSENVVAESILKYLSTIQGDVASMAVDQPGANSSAVPMEVNVPSTPKAAETPKAADSSDAKLSESKSADKPAEPTPVPLIPRVNPLPEVELYLQLLLLILLIDRKMKVEACECSSELVEKLATFNRRTMDHISAKIYYYFSLSYERAGRFSEIRPTLLSVHRTASLRHDEPSMIVLTNAVLRNYLHYNLYSQASKFEAIVKLDEDTRVDNNSLARYHYYVGKIASIELHYSLAHTHLTQAIRKAPQKGAVGFRQAAHKLMIIVQLLMGDIPERSTFRLPALHRSLKPYFQLTQAVRAGDLALFKEVMSKFKDNFVNDRTYSLIIRLRHNVIKTGLRRINLSYSRISIKDICTKLHFDNEEDAEYVIAKAVADGVIDAVIDSNQRCIYSKENEDMYSTHEPQKAFDKRIRYCMEVHNGAVKALRFPPNASQHKLAKKDPDSPVETDSFEISEDF